MWTAMRRSFVLKDSRRLAHLTHVVRIEDALARGVPDVEGCVSGLQFWCELKSIPRFPFRTQTVIAVPHFTIEQREFLRLRHLAGGRAFLLLRVQEERLWLLFRGDVAAGVVGRTARAALLAGAAVAMRPGFRKEEFVDILLRYWSPL